MPSEAGNYLIQIFVDSCSSGMKCNMVVGCHSFFEVRCLGEAMSFTMQPRRYEKVDLCELWEFDPTYAWSLTASVHKWNQVNNGTK